MEKKSKKKKSFLKILAIGLVSIFSCFSMSGCIGAMGGSGNVSGGSSGTVKPPPEYENPYEGESDKAIQDYNDVFEGAIGVYETDNDAEVFYDNYSQKYVNFNTLIDRQFSALATTIWGALNYVYGSGDTITTVEGYGDNKSFSSDKLIKNAIVYNYLIPINESGNLGNLRYKNAINGGYKLIETKIKTEVKDAEGNTMYDENGEIVYSITYEYAYSNSEIDSGRKWNKNGITKSEIVDDLKYIYSNTISVSSTSNELKLEDDSNLKSEYSHFTKSGNTEIKTIGFSKEFMWNVLYYIAYHIIGAGNINCSIEAEEVVFTANTLNSVTHENFGRFEEYKGYEKILPEIVSNAFKMQISGTNIVVGNSFCFDISKYNFDDNKEEGFFNKTLFPIMERNEYIFFDDVNDICDAEESSSIFDEDYDFENPKSEEEIENETIKVGSLRKIKKIILIPKIDKAKYNYETFLVEYLMLCLTTTSGELELEIFTTLVDETEKEYKDKQLLFDDGSFSVEMGDGTTVSGSGSDEMVTKNGHLIVQSTPSVNKYSNLASIFESEKEAEGYKFSSVSEENISRIRDSFKNDSYDVSTTGEKIDIGRINVCNQLFNMQAVDTTKSSNGVLSTIYTDDKNILEFDFKYYNKGGSEMTSIPELYLLEFSVA